MMPGVILGGWFGRADQYSRTTVGRNGRTPTVNRCSIIVFLHLRSGSLAEGRLGGLDAIVVPGGFGVRGVEGKSCAMRHAREHGIPFLGLCLGLQSAVIELGRNVAGLEGANSSEFEPTTRHPVIDLMTTQRGLTQKGGTMRLGAYPCVLEEKSIARRLYNRKKTSERHRHRYEVNNAYREKLEAGGLVLSGLSPDGGLVEMIELPDHPWFVASQFHPELKSRPMDCHPLFRGFIKAALQHRARRREAPLLGGLKVVKR